MITKVLRNHLNTFMCSFATMKKVGREYVIDLPQADYPIRKEIEYEDRFPTSVAYKNFHYVKKDPLPNCRYFAVEYNARIHHFFNAYYYPMGRMMNRVAEAIRGKNSPHYKAYTAQVKEGDICVIVNIEDPLVTGKKLLFKKLRYHTGFIGHLREYSYRHVLNTKPQLLYHYLLRRVMPKNKLSAKYLENIVLCRGPTHNFKDIPQFAPDKKIYEYLPQTDLYQLVKNDPSYKVVHESTPGAAQKILGKQVEFYEDDRIREQKRRDLDENVEDISQVYEQLPKYKTVAGTPKKHYLGMKTLEKKIQERYNTVRAPYRKKKVAAQKTGLKMYRSEKKARKDPNYQLLNNEELQEIDEELTAPNPHVGGPVQPPKKA